jgi:hypothetical protein
MIAMVFGHFCDEEAIDEIAGRKAGTHGTERLQVGDEFGAKFYGQGPERFVLDDVQGEVPAFRAIEREILAVDDVQATRNEEVAVIIHPAEFDHHALLDWLDEFLFVGGRKIFLLEPVREGEAAAGLQELHRRREEFPRIMVVRNRFDGPKQIKWLRKLHVLRVHQQKAGVQVRLGRRFSGHLHLHGRNGDACGTGAVLSREIETGAPKAAADVQNARAGFYVCELREMVDELDLRGFLRFIATDPVAMVYMLAPQRAVVRTNEVVVFNNFVLLVDARDVHRELPKGFRICIRRQEIILPRQWALSSPGHPEPQDFTCTIPAFTTHNRSTLELCAP